MSRFPSSTVGMQLGRFSRLLDRSFVDVQRYWIDRVLAVTPIPIAEMLAQLLASPREIRPLPAWDFGLEYLDTSSSSRTLAQHVRRSLWRYFIRREVETPIKLRWVSGLKVLTYLGGDTAWPLFVGGCFEPNEMAFLKTELQPGMVFVDVGANEGLFSLLGATLVGRDGVVVAVEPSQREFDRLAANVKANRLSNIRSLRLALSNHEGHADLRIAASDHSGQNTLGDFVYAGVRTARVERVPLGTLDGVVDTMRLQRVDVVKVDVEGSELDVLEGARVTLRRFRPTLILEILEPALRQRGASGDVLIRHLVDRGYELLSFDELSGLPTPLKVLPDASCNLVAIHPGRRPS